MTKVTKIWPESGCDEKCHHETQSCSVTGTDQAGRQGQGDRTGEGMAGQGTKLEIVKWWNIPCVRAGREDRGRIGSILEHHSKQSLNSNKFFMGIIWEISNKSCLSSHVVSCHVLQYLVIFSPDQISLKYLVRPAVHISARRSFWLFISGIQQWPALSLCQPVVGSKA